MKSSAKNTSYVVNAHADSVRRIPKIIFQFFPISRVIYTVEQHEADLKAVKGNVGFLEV